MPALAGVVKPNAAVPLIALTIGALLLALRDGNPKLLLWAALSCASGRAFSIVFSGSLKAAVMNSRSFARVMAT